MQEDPEEFMNVQGLISWGVHIEQNSDDDKRTDHQAAEKYPFEGAVG